MVEWLAVAVALLILGAASYTDIKTRRVPSYFWSVGFELSIVILSFQIWQATSGIILQEDKLIRIGISVVLLVGLGLVFSPWGLHLFGGADAKAFILIGLLLPITPSATVFGTTFPIAQSQLGILSMSVIVNGFLLTLFYPIFLFVRNLGGESPLSKWSFVSRPVQVSKLVDAHGKIVTSTDGNTQDGLDLDALRMYLRWRGITLDELQSNPNRYRTVTPRSTEQPTDGRVLDADGAYGTDPWAAEAFLREHNAYGTTPEQLRDGLDVIVTQDYVLVMPGIPLIVSLFIGLATAIVVGDFVGLFVQLL